MFSHQRGGPYEGARSRNSNVKPACVRCLKSLNSHASLIDERSLEPSFFAGYSIAMRPKPSRSSSRSSKRFGNEEVNVDSLPLRHPRPQLVGSRDETCLAHRRLYLRLGRQSARIECDVPVCGIRRDRKAGSTWVQVNGLCADEDDSVPVSAERFERIQENVPCTHVQRIRPAKRVRPAPPSGSVPQLQRVHARGSSEGQRRLGSGLRT